MKLHTKFLVILGFVLIVVASIMLSQNQITGYELSIYDSVFLPLFGIIICFFINIIVVVESIWNGWKYGKALALLNIGLCCMLIILLPSIKGYVYASLADNASHIGYILDILITGHIHQNNIYPIVHLWGAILVSITGLPSYIVAYLIPPCYYFIYGLSIFLLCRLVSSGNVALIASICSLTPLCYYYSQIMPMGVGFMTFPLLIFFLIKLFHHQSLKLSITFLIYMLIIPFLHPLAFLITLGILILFLIVVTIYGPKLQIKSMIPSLNLNVTRYIMYFIILSLIVFFYWSLQNLIIDGVLRSVISLLDMSPEAIAPVSDAGNAFAKLGLNFSDIILLYIRLYGPLTIFGFFSIWGSLHILNWLRSLNFTKSISQYKYIFSLIFVYLVFFSFCIVAAIDFIRPLTGLGSQRFLFSVYSLIPVPAALGFSTLLPETQIYLNRNNLHLFNKSKQVNIFRSVCLILILSICLFIATFSFFTSPAVYRPNGAITVKEIYGAEWIMNNGFSDYNVLWDGKSVSPPFHYSDVIFGTVSDVKYPKTEPNLDGDEFAHFRYEKYSTLGSSISKNKYLMLRENVNLLIYRELYPLLARYTPLDYMILSSDSSVNLLYSNNEVEVYFVLAL